MRLIGYVRVSTEEQAKEGVSLGAQRERLAGYVTSQGGKVALVDVEEDAGVSAKSLDRPGLQRALGRLENGEAEGLAVVKLDRLTRSVADLQALHTSHFGETCPYQLVSLSESVDTRKAGGRMMLNMIVTIAQWEREVICERTNEAFAHKRNQGENLGTVPYGYRLVEADPARSKSGRPVRLEVNPEELATVANILDWKSEGTSLRAIAGALNAAGVPTRRGGPWVHSTIQSILERIERWQRYEHDRAPAALATSFATQSTLRISA